MCVAASVEDVYVTACVEDVYVTASVEGVYVLLVLRMCMYCLC